jgi:hypothetical protein
MSAPKPMRLLNKHDQAVVDALGMTLRIRGKRDRIVFYSPEGITYKIF